MIRPWSLPTVSSLLYDAIVDQESNSQQLPYLHPQPFSYLLDALEGEVSFSSFYAAHVGAVYAQDFGKGFLAEASFQTVGTQIRAYRPLEVSDSHAPKAESSLLDSLQTYE